MRRIKVRIHKGRVVEPPDLPEEVRGELTILEDDTRETDRRQLLDKTNRAYALLKKDRKAWQEEQQERTLWESTLTDGLDSGDRVS
jgi:hypothetical protein